MHGSEFVELRVFVAVAERANFARAAEYLGAVPSTVSQTIKSLEDRLGVRLLNRTTRKVSLTDAGERLLTRVRPAITELAAAIDDLNDFRDTPTGTLRLTVSSIAAQTVLAPILGDFRAAYPAIRLEVTVDDTESDIVGGRFDAGIRIGRRVARDMQMLRVSRPLRLIAVAAPAYLAHHTAPTEPVELQNHNCIVLRVADRVIPWEFEKGKTKVAATLNAALTVNNMALLVRATLDGIGVGYTFDSYVADDIAEGRLVQLLREWSPPQHSYYLYYSGRGHLPVPLKALIDFFRQHNDAL